MGQFTCCIRVHLYSTVYPMGYVTYQYFSLAQGKYRNISTVHVDTPFAYDECTSYIKYLCMYKISSSRLTLRRIYDISVDDNLCPAHSVFSSHIWVSICRSAYGIFVCSIYQYTPTHWSWNVCECYCLKGPFLWVNSTLWEALLL